MANLKTIVEDGFCIGCGGCSAIDGFKGEVSLDKFGMYKPTIVDQAPEVEKEILKVCPFSGDASNEYELAKELYYEESNYNNQIGFYKALYAGHALKDGFRENGSSGGLISWILSKLISSNKVDFVIHVKESKDKERLFQYGISSTIEEIKQGSKSKYYPIEMSQVIELIRTNPGNYALVGLPCFVKAIRRLANVDPLIKSRVVYCIGLVCGHLKSTGFAESFGWQLGVKPESLNFIDFRVKLPNSPSNAYGVLVKSDKVSITKPVRGLKGSNWGHNLFRNPACSYCDDVFAETADMSIGDAWLPQYEKDSLGTSVLVVRNKEILEIIEQAKEEGELMIDSLSEKEMISSQAGGLRDRREGLAYRLFLKKNSGKWFPNKRVEPSDRGLSKERKELYQIREASSNESHQAWLRAKNENNLSIFDSYFDALKSRIDNNLSLITKIRIKLSPFKKKFKMFFKSNNGLQNTK